MEPFAAAVKIAQSDDNSHVIFTDNSNYLTNTDGVTALNVFARQVIITDMNGATVATVPLTLQDDNSYAGQFAIPTDMYYRYTINITLADETTVKTGYTDYVSDGYYESAYIEVMQNYLGDCGCSKGSVCTNLTWAMHNHNSAIIFGKKGMGVLSQTAITAANKLLNSILNG